MRGLVAVAVLACTLTPFTQATAQRWQEGRIGAQQPVHRDTTRGRSRDALFVQRAMVATATSAAILLPTVAAYRSTGSERLLVGGVLTQLAVTSYVAATAKGSQRCSKGRRMWLALGGALMGSGGAMLFAETEYQEQHPHEHTSLMRPMGISALALGVPLGAAAGLYNCN